MPGPPQEWKELWSRRSRIDESLERLGLWQREVAFVKAIEVWGDHRPRAWWGSNYLWQLLLRNKRDDLIMRMVDTPLPARQGDLVRQRCASLLTKTQVLFSYMLSNQTGPCITMLNMSPVDRFEKCWTIS
jgi:hypothetical protein